MQLDVGSGELVTSEIAAFITPQALITVRKDDGFDIDGLVARWDDSPDLAEVRRRLPAPRPARLRRRRPLRRGAVARRRDRGAGGPAVRRAGRRTGVQRRSFELRKSLVVLRRVVLPMREVVNSLMRRDVGLVPDEMTPYYQDVYDHVLRATEWTECLRDLVTTILETNLTIQGNRLNVITKKVTSWAAIIAVPTRSPASTARTSPTPASARPGASCPAWSSSRSSPGASTPCSSGRDGCEQVGRFRGCAAPDSGGASAGCRSARAPRMCALAEPDKSLGHGPPSRRAHAGRRYQVVGQCSPRRPVVVHRGRHP